MSIVWRWGLKKPIRSLKNKWRTTSLARVHRSRPATCRQKPNKTKEKLRAQSLPQTAQAEGSTRKTPCHALATCAIISMQVLLISTYELGRRPFGLASPAAWLQKSGASVTCLDLSVQPFEN